MSDEARQVLKDAGLEGEGDELIAAAGSEAQALEWARARASGAPLGHLLGKVRFMGLELLAGPGALAPRAETELLGRTAVTLLGEQAVAGAGLRVIDMCCGAGNLASAIATQLTGLQVWASDLTDGCVHWARANVARHGLKERVRVLQGDLFAPLAGAGLEGQVSMVVCNPPYISTGRLEKDRAALLTHEPREAFDGGPYGLSIHQRVIKEALPFLAPGGWLLFEIGLGQERQLKLLFERSRAYGPLEYEHDASGAPRVVRARKKD